MIPAKPLLIADIQSTRKMVGDGDDGVFLKVRLSKILLFD
jgi:hypothetical protein